MNLKQIGSVTPAGQAAFRDLISDTAKVTDPAERRERALAIINDPELCVPVEGAGHIDLDMRFGNVLEFAEHVHEALAPLGTAILRDRGVNLFLYCAYIDQLVKERARKLDSYFLDEKTKGGDIHIIRNYRNAVFVHLSFYHLHKDSAHVCQALLGGPANELSNVMEKIAQNNDIMGSRAAMELVVAMFFDPKTGRYRRAPKAKSRSVKPKSAGKALQELSAIVFTQCGRNFDVSRLTAQQMFRLVPSTSGLSGWKRYAAERFDEEEAEARAAA